MTKKQKVIEKNKDVIEVLRPTIRKEIVPLNIFAAEPQKNQPESLAWAFLVEFPEYNTKGVTGKDAANKLMNLVKGRLFQKDFIGIDEKRYEGARALLSCLSKIGKFEIIGFDIGVNVVSDISLDN